ncbi:MAG TPA: hypothetical protein VIG25_22825, partial [Pyrinomonadaceae bacterium]
MLTKCSQSSTRLLRLESTIARLERRSAQLEKINRQYWRARRVLFVAGTLVTLIALEIAGLRIGVLAAALFVFLFTVVAAFHNKVRDGMTRNSLMLAIKQVQVARIDLDWEHLAPADHLPSNPDHPFETDIDLTGDRSLHRLLDTAATTEGSRRLRSWLMNNSPEAAIIAERQLLVRELERLCGFRDKLHLYATLVSSQVTAQQLGPERVYKKDRWDSHTLVSWVEHV